MDLYHVLSALVKPPAALSLVLLLGLVLRRRAPRASLALLWLGTLLLIALSLPLGAHYLAASLESYPPLKLPLAGGADAPQAIVVLAGGRYSNAPEYDADTVSPHTLERVRYAAYLHRMSGLPILVTGGSTQGEAVPEAELMATALTRDFRVPVQWIEQASRTTRENAIFTSRMLAPDNIKRVYLVTHARHMRRALLAFEHAGLLATPAPLGYSTLREGGVGATAFLPSAGALRKSSEAVHEYVGYWWYRLRIAISGG